jgi:hypothetical protein
MFEVLKSGITKRHADKKTMAELFSLSNRQLRALGLQRANSTAHARQATR